MVAVRPSQCVDEALLDRIGEGRRVEGWKIRLVDTAAVGELKQGLGGWAPLAKFLRTPQSAILTTLLSLNLLVQLGMRAASSVTPIQVEQKTYQLTSDWKSIECKDFRPFFSTSRLLSTSSDGLHHNHPTRTHPGHHSSVHAGL